MFGCKTLEGLLRFQAKLPFVKRWKGLGGKALPMTPSTTLNSFLFSPAKT